MNTLKTLFLTIFLMAALSATSSAAEPATVFVSILPQKYMVERIAKDKINVHVMVQPGASPATYEPKPAQMAALTKTSIYFSIGAPFENFWLEKIAASNPEMTIVHTDHGIKKIPMAAHTHGDHDHAGHDHGDHHHGDHDHGEHEEAAGHGTMDPHIWNSPALVKIQARTICRALAAEDPANTAFYNRNCDEFIQEIHGLEAEINALLKERAGTRFMVFHPSWGYFARDFGLTMIPIEIEGKDPKPAQLMAQIRRARELGIRVIFVQPQFSDKSARLIAREINGRVVAADPLALDWMENMKTIATRLKEALK